MAKVTIEQITVIARNFLRENYDMELSIPIKRNNRLKLAMGRYVCEHDWSPYCIDIAGFMFDHATDEQIVDTLKHELIHYAMHVAGLPFDDADPEFIAELKLRGVSESGTDYVTWEQEVHTYLCGCKGSVHKRISPYPNKGRGRHCSKCGTQIRYDGKKIDPEYSY